MADLEVAGLIDINTLDLETAELLNQIKNIKRKKVHSPFKGNFISLILLNLTSLQLT